MIAKLKKFLVAVYKGKKKWLTIALYGTIISMVMVTGGFILGLRWGFDSFTQERCWMDKNNEIICNVFIH